MSNSLAVLLPTASRRQHRAGTQPNGAANALDWDEVLDALVRCPVPALPANQGPMPSAAAGHPSIERMSGLLEALQ
jgi:hypothetical protein